MDVKGFFRMEDGGEEGGIVVVEAEAVYSTSQACCFQPILLVETNGKFGLLLEVDTENCFIFYFDVGVYLEKYPNPPGPGEERDMFDFIASHDDVDMKMETTHEGLITINSPQDSCEYAFPYLKRNNNNNKGMGPKKTPEDVATKIQATATIQKHTAALTIQSAYRQYLEGKTATATNKNHDPTTTSCYNTADAWCGPSSTLGSLTTKLLLPMKAGESQQKSGSRKVIAKDTEKRQQIIVRARWSNGRRQLDHNVLWKGGSRNQVEVMELTFNYTQLSYVFGELSEKSKSDPKYLGQKRGSWATQRTDAIPVLNDLWFSIQQLDEFFSRVSSWYLVPGARINCYPAVIWFPFM